MFVDIEKFYKRQPAEVLFFGYVNALLFNLPTASLESAILNFQRHHQISEDLMNIETAKTTYKRMRDEYIETQKTKH